MFYSQLLLAKKGPLAKVWMAAHWDKKLTKQAIVQTDIRSSAEQLKKPQTPLSLRMSGHLLLGLSRIFARKVQYLYHDSSEAFAHMKSGSRPAIDLDVQEGGGGGNIDMQAQPGGAAAALLLQADDAQLFNFDFGGDGGAIPLVGDHLGGEDWVNVGTQGAWGSQQQAGAPGSAARSALRMGRGYAPLPHEAADEENFDVPGLAPSAGRSAITGSGSASDAELERARLDGLARKSAAGGAAGRGSELDSDDNRSVVSENDDSVRRGRRGRSSLLPGNADFEGGVAGKASLKGRLGAGIDAADADLLGMGAAHDEFGLGDIMGLTGALATGGDADDVEMAAGGVGARGGQEEGEPQAAPGEGAGDYDYYEDGGAQGVAPEDQPEAGDAAAAAAGGAFGTPKAARSAAAAAAAAVAVQREASEASSLSAHGGSSESVGGDSDAADAEAAAAAAAKAETAKASRALKKAQRDAERIAALQRKPDDKTMLPSDVIKGWLGDTSKITKPLLEGEAFAEHLRRRHEEVAHARVKATMAPGPAAAKRFAATFPFPGAWSALATLEMLEACPPDAAHTGPDGDALRPVPLVVDVDAEFAGCYSVFGPGVPRGPAAYARTTLAMARLMISHVHGTAVYGRDPNLADEEEEVYGGGAVAALASASKPAASAAAPAHRGAAPAKGADDDDDAMAGGAGQQEHEPQAAPGEGAGDYDYYEDGGAQGVEMPGGAEANGFALNADVHVDGDLAGPGVDEHGNVAALGRRSAAAVSAGSPGVAGGAATGSVASSADRAPAKDDVGGASDAASVRSSGAPGGDDESDARSADGVAAAAAATQLLSASARKAAGHHGAFLGNERTAKMLSILAEEMTGPALAPEDEAGGAGAKRKSRPAPPAYNLADLRHGKGTPADPVSFFELAEGSTAPVAALSFYQLLTLKTLDVIQIKQAEPYGDVLITRTAQFAPAVAEMKKKAAAAVAAQ